MQIKEARVNARTENTDPNFKGWKLPGLDIVGAEANCTLDKKLSCCRWTARCFVSLSISLSHLRSLKVIENDSLEKGPSPCQYFVVTMSVSRTVSDILSGK